MSETSRQRAWQLEQQANGNCIICAKPRSALSNAYCETHVLAARQFANISTKLRHERLRQQGRCVACQQLLPKAKRAKEGI